MKQTININILKFVTCNLFLSAFNWNDANFVIFLKTYKGCSIQFHKHFTCQHSFYHTYYIASDLVTETNVLPLAFPCLV